MTDSELGRQVLKFLIKSNFGEYTGPFFLTEGLINNNVDLTDIHSMFPSITVPVQRIITIHYNRKRPHYRKRMIKRMVCDPFIDVHFETKKFYKFRNSLHRIAELENNMPLNGNKKQEV